MVSYLYRCDVHGSFEIRATMGEANANAGCPRCGAAARRVYSAPLLGFAPADRMAAIDRAERSASEPEVVARPVGRRRTTRPGTPAWATNPALARLPRP